MRCSRCRVEYGEHALVWWDPSVCKECRLVELREEWDDVKNNAIFGSGSEEDVKVVESKFIRIDREIRERMKHRALMNEELEEPII